MLGSFTALFRLFRPRPKPAPTIRFELGDEALEALANASHLQSVLGACQSCPRCPVVCPPKDVVFQVTEPIETAAGGIIAPGRYKALDVMGTYCDRHLAIIEPVGGGARQVICLGYVNPATGTGFAIDWRNIQKG